MKIPSIFQNQILLLFTLGVMAGCSKDATDPAPAPSGLPVLTTTDLTAVTATSAKSGGTISSDGGNTITQKGICWSTSPAPDTNQTSKTKDGSGNGSFTSTLTGLKVGTQYYVRAYAVNSKGISFGNEVRFTTPGSSNPCDLSGVDKGFLEYEFTKDSVLEPGTYKMNRNFTVKAGKRLTLKPGVVIEAQGVFEFKIEGTIKSLGTATCPVLFTSKAKSAGNWYGVYVNSNDTANLFDFTIFEYGGAGSSDINKVCARFSPNNSGQKSTASFRNCIFRNSAGYGFVSDDEANDLETLESCAFSNNGFAPISVCWEQAEFIKASCTYSNNTNNYIFLSAPAQVFSKDIKLAKQPVPYQINGQNFILKAKPFKLSVGPGVTLVMTSNMHFQFYDNSVADFQGTASDPIIIKGKNNTAGEWGGFLFIENAGDNVFRHVRFSDGGNATTNGIQKGMINIGSGASPTRITIENCSFSSSGNFGVGVYDYNSNTPPPSVGARNVVNGATRSAIPAAFSAAGNTAGSNLLPGLITVYQ